MNYILYKLNKLKDKFKNKFNQLLMVATKENTLRLLITIFVIPANRAKPAVTSDKQHWKIFMH